MNKNININGVLFDFAYPRVMGIVNVSPDSFYEGSRSIGQSTIRNRIEEMVESGVDIVDIGGYSSRPGAVHISAKEEIERVSVALEIVRKFYPDKIVSLDTFRAGVAEFGIKEFRVDIINDISGGSLDSGMFPLIAKENVPYILMHMQGTPETMQNNPSYRDVVNDIIHWFSVRIKELVSLGVNDIIVDPGFGFGKSQEHNYELLGNLQKFDILERPLLAGISRKSMIWRTLEITPDESLSGTVALNMFALVKGANIIRVHDIMEAVQTVKLFNRLAHND